ncbi:MAG: hypothetical protein H6850_03800 [Alphaproteobacteria bacterium]|nr:MAG: hypothetical protein H6850_03800 [Alphaproteobacteria bacterium]
MFLTLIMLGFLTSCGGKHEISKESPLVFPDDMNKLPPEEKKKTNTK